MKKLTLLFIFLSLLIGFAPGQAATVTEDATYGLGALDQVDTLKLSDSDQERINFAKDRFKFIIANVHEVPHGSEIDFNSPSFKLCHDTYARAGYSESVAADYCVGLEKSGYRGFENPQFGACWATYDRAGYTGSGILSRCMKMVH